MRQVSYLPTGHLVSVLGGSQAQGQHGQKQQNLVAHGSAEGRRTGEDGKTAGSFLPRTPTAPSCLQLPSGNPRPQQELD